MGWFNKRSEVLDLTDRYRKQQEKLAAMKEEAKTESPAMPFGFGTYGGSTTSSSSATSYSDLSSGNSPEDKRKKLAKRLMDITDKLEDLSKQLYHLQQRLEVVEKKGGSSSGVGNFGVFN